jgi:hypothetical protein
MEENMPYIIFSAGIILIIYAIIGLRREGFNLKGLGGEMEGGEFARVLSENLYIKRLDSIEKKLDTLLGIESVEDKEAEGVPVEERNTQLNIRDIYLTEINREIYRMQSEGAGIEDIAARTGQTKGEILLRLGMKK